jgi:cobalamin synthase
LLLASSSPVTSKPGKLPLSVTPLTAAAAAVLLLLLLLLLPSARTPTTSEMSMLLPMVGLMMWGVSCSCKKRSGGLAGDTFKSCETNQQVSSSSSSTHCYTK